MCGILLFFNTNDMLILIPFPLLLAGSDRVHQEKEKKKAPTGEIPISNPSPPLNSSPPLPTNSAGYNA